MNRRSVLKSPALTAVAAAPAMAVAARAAPAPSRQGQHVVVRDGARLFLRDWGAGPSVLFLAGWALPSEFWSYQMVPLSDAGMRCLAYDRRGHGASDDPGRGYGYDQLADDLADVIDAIDPPHPLVVVAHSMACGEVVRYVRRYGSRRVAGVVMVGATLPTVARSPSNPQGIAPEQYEAYRKSVIFADFPKWLQDNAKPFFAPETSQDMMDWVKGSMLRCSMKAAADCHRAQTDTDFSDELGAVDVPLLLIHGDKDMSAPIDATSRIVARRLPKAELKVYEGAPHGLPVTHAGKLNADLMRFVQERTQAS